MLLISEIVLFSSLLILGCYRLALDYRRDFVFSKCRVLQKFLRYFGFTMYGVLKFLWDFKFTECRVFQKNLRDFGITKVGRNRSSSGMSNLLRIGFTISSGIWVMSDLLSAGCYRRTSRISDLLSAWCYRSSSRI